jgi:hypothetical protein
MNAMAVRIRLRNPSRFDLDSKLRPATVIPILDKKGNLPVKRQ